MTAPTALLRRTLPPARWLACAAALTVGLAASARPAPPSAPPPALPAALAGAEQVARLPGGAWLALAPSALRLLDARGQEQARIDMRGEHLDVRATPHGAIAVLLDADTQRLLRVGIDTGYMRMESLTVLQSPPFPVEAMCLWRDAQGTEQVFLLADEGVGQHWLLRPGAEARLVRTLAVGPHPQGCVVDDEAGTLLVNEAGLGVMAYRAEAEGPPRREPVLLRRPMGPLDGGAGALARLPGGVAVADGNGRRVHLLPRTGPMRWGTARVVALPDGGDVESLSVATGDDAARIDLLWHAADAGWRQRALPWNLSAAAGLPKPLPQVRPAVQTDPVDRWGDAADDPAIWIHPTDPARSLVLATNKRQGLLSYDLSGRQRQLLETGRVNNVDLRQAVKLGAHTLDLAVATQRDDLSIVVYTLDADGTLAEHTRLPTGLPDIYGICVHTPAAGGMEVFVNDKSGDFQRWRLAADAQGQVSGRVVQRFKLATQPEACVADDAAGRLFIGEEDTGVWAMDISPAAGLGDRPALRPVLRVGPVLHADVEGLALVRRDDGGAWLVISSQGNDSYVLVDAAPPHAVRGAFRVGADAARGIDGVSETDGLDATSRPLGPAFPRGVLVLQDGFKRMPDDRQNFKLVDWGAVERALGLR